MHLIIHQLNLSYFQSPTLQPKSPLQMRLNPNTNHNSLKLDGFPQMITK